MVGRTARSKSSCRIAGCRCFAARGPKWCSANPNMHSNSTPPSSFSRLLWLLETLVEVVVFALYAWRGARFMRESAAGPVGTGMLLGMLGFALLWLAELPFDVISLWWERRHGLVTEGYWQVIFGGWSALGFEFVVLAAALGIVMAIAKVLHDRWWIAAAPLLGAVTLLLAFVSPYLTTSHPLRNPTLVADVHTLEKRDHLRSIPVAVQKVSRATSLPNAETMGFGSSTKVVVWDTMLSGRFTGAEVRVVIAHELGHAKSDHILKGVLWSVLFAFPSFYVVARLARRRGGIRQPEAVPLALLAFVVVQLVSAPAQSLVTRHMEAEADWIALQSSRDPAAADGLFKAFVPTSLDEPNPPTWDYVMLENHPTIMQRLAMVAAWRRYAAVSDQLP